MKMEKWSENFVKCKCIFQKKTIFFFLRFLKKFLKKYVEIYIKNVNLFKDSKNFFFKFVDDF